MHFWEAGKRDRKGQNRVRTKKDVKVQRALEGDEMKRKADIWRPWTVTEERECSVPNLQSVKRNVRNPVVLSFSFDRQKENCSSVPSK